MPLPSLWALGFPFLFFKLEGKGFSWSFHCLCPVAHVQLSGRENGKLTPSAGVLQILIFFLNSPATICLSESPMHSVQVLLLQLGEMGWNMLTPWYSVHSFLSRRGVPLHSHTSVCLSILLLKVFVVVSRFCLLKIKHILSFVLGKYLGVGKLGHMAGICIFKLNFFVCLFRELLKCFPKSWYHFAFLLADQQHSQGSTSPTDPGQLVFLV